MNDRHCAVDAVNETLLLLYVVIVYDVIDCLID